MNDFTEKVFDEFENDLKLYYCGKRIYNFSHYFGPYDRDTYLLYYIKEGKALLQNQGEAITLSGNGFFVNFPQSRTVYRCVDKIPWSIQWIAVEGNTIEKYLQLLGITREQPFLPLSDGQPVEELFDEMYENFDKGTLASKLYCISLVHKLFSIIAEEQKEPRSHNPYIRAALQLMESNYSDAGFNVRAMADQVGLQYNYFSVLFKKELGESPVTILSDYRLNLACKLLKYTNKPIYEVASHCGFSDELYFSRSFRKKYGVSPSYYRKIEEYPT